MGMGGSATAIPDKLQSEIVRRVANHGAARFHEGRTRRTPTHEQGLPDRRRK